MRKRWFCVLLAAVILGFCAWFLWNWSLENICSKEEATLPTETEPAITQEEFLDSIENPQIRILYEQLYDIYEFGSLERRSPIPLYFQTVYTDKFSTGTIQSAGCGITCLAMVASYLFDETITPDMMLKYDCGNNPAAAMEAGIEDMGLNCKTHYGKAALTNLDAALDAGKPVIILHQAHSYFTKSGHFLVVAGRNPDGTYIINDPNMINYYNERLVDGYINGFPWEDISAGLVGLYIFDSKDEFVDRRN